MEQQLVLKTSLFGGFDRQSVLNYVYEMNNSAKAAQDRLCAQLEEVGAAREKLSDTLRSLEQQLMAAENAKRTLGDELSGEKAKNNELAAMLDSLNQEIKRQHSIIEEKDVKITRYSKIKEELEHKNASLEQKRQEIEKISIYIGEMSVRARMDSEQILEKAETQAKIVLEDASEQARNLVEEATKSLSSVFEQFDKFRSEMEAIEEKIEDAVVTMQKKFAAIGNALAESEQSIRDFYRPCNISLVTDGPKTAANQATNKDDKFFRSAADK